MTEKDTFLKEVELEEREDKLWSALYRWGPWVLGFCVVGFGTWAMLAVMQQNYEKSVGQVSKVFDQGVELYKNQSYQQARDVFARVIKHPKAGGYRSLAMAYQAAIVQDDWRVSQSSQDLDQLRTVYQKLRNGHGQAWRNAWHVAWLSLLWKGKWDLSTSVIDQDLKTFMTPQNPWKTLSVPLLALRTQDRKVLLESLPKEQMVFLQTLGLKMGWSALGELDS